MRFKKILIIFILLLSVSAFAFARPIMSIDCDPNMSVSGLSQNDLNTLVGLCSQKVNDLRNQANTLSSQIQYMDTQIYLTGLQIEDTKQKIITTQKEIDTLGTRIEGLNTSLDYLSNLLIDKIVESYKQRSVSLITILLDSIDANDLISQVKYLKTTRQNNQNLLLQVQETKTNFEEQKNLREEKTVELNNLQTTLNQQQTNLSSQKAAKQQLLAATQNDETIYENLLNKARQELAGFSAFTQSAGGGLTTFGNGSNGWYYTQRDPQWGNMILPGSSTNVMTAGCAVTSVAMVCKSYGQNITPATIVSDPSKFIGGDLWNWAFSCSGKSTDWLGSNEDQVKSYVKNNTPVILRLSVPSVSGLHFVVAYKWDDGKNDFIIHDPYYGPDKNFSDRYNWSQVTTAIAIH